MLEGTEFRVGGDSGCGIFFDPRLDPPACGRSVLFRLASDGWRVESTGAGEVLINQAPVVQETPIRSGDLVRLSEFGPDFSFAVTSRTAAAADSTGTVSTRPTENRPAVGARGIAKSDAGPEDASCNKAGEEKPSPPPIPSSFGSRWKSSVGAGVAAAAVLVAVAIWNQPQKTAGPEAAGTMSDEPDSVGAEANSAVVQPVPAETADDRPEATVVDADPPQPTQPTPQPTPEEEPEAKPAVEEDPWVRLEKELAAALFIVQVEVSGPKGDFSWPFVTSFAIDDHTLLTSAREVLQLAALRKEGCRIWAVHPASGFKAEVGTLRVPRQFADLSATPGDWIYFNWGLLVTEDQLPKSGSLASSEELRDLEEGLPVACFGFPHDGGKITRFDQFKPELARGKIYLIDHSPAPAGDSRLLELKARIPENMYGSPILNRRGAVVAVYGEAASSEGVGVKDLHYAPVLDRELLRSWLDETDKDHWVAPPVPEKPSSQESSSPAQPQ